VSASVERLGGVISADLNFASATLLVEFDPDLDPRADIERVVEGTGHGIARLDESGRAEEVAPRPWIERNLALVATVGSGSLSAVGALLGWAGAPEILPTAAFALAIAFGGFLVWRRALVSLKARVMDMNVLMSTAVFGAMLLGEWGEGATVFFLYALGGLLESRSLERTRRSIGELMDLAPPIARVKRGDEQIEVDVAGVGIGDVVVVRPGERVSLDGVVVRGSSGVDESAITGESVLADKTAGDRVFAGTLNTSGLLEIEVGALATDSTLSHIVHLVEEAQASRAPVQRFVDRFSAVYTPSVIVLAALVAVVPPLAAAALGAEWGSAAEWLRRALVVLVVSCPCALVISTPVSIVSAITRASRDGVLVKGGAFLEAAAGIRAVAFDKTGTLTSGHPALVAVESLGTWTREEVLAIASALESHSNHPVARAIVAAAPARSLARVDAYTETPGRGVRGVLDGVTWELCNPECARESGDAAARLEASVADMEAAGMTVLALVRIGEGPVALLGVADEVRAEAPRALEELKRLGVEHLVMLTGDNERVAASVAERAGVTSYLARLLPQGKTDAIGVLKERHGAVAMVGDGVNDAPALAAADIGIAMGAVGTDTALETADVVLMRDDLGALPRFLSLGRRTMNVIAQNVTVSIGIKVVFLALALTGKATLWMAVFADTGVSLLVILNGMRLLRRPSGDEGV
jgi:Cd2+/Zn2+-exporting ATPase